MYNEQNMSIKTWKFTTYSIAILHRIPLFQPRLQRKSATLQTTVIQFLQQVLLGWWFFIGQISLPSSGYLYRSTFLEECWHCNTMFNLWAQITDWVDNISSSFYISPSFLPSPFLWIILSTYLHKCHVYQFRERSVPYFFSYPGACTLPWETQNENKLCQTISLSKLIKMHGVLVCEGFLLSKVSEKAMHAGILAFKFKCTKYWLKYAVPLIQIFQVSLEPT